jgi:hypothetical protein
VFNKVESLLACMMKLSCARNLFDLSTVFQRRENELSMMTNATMKLLYDKYSRQTQNLSNWAFLFGESADAYARKGFPYTRCFAMLDGKLFRTGRPSDEDIEISAFSGHRHCHGNNYQAFVTAHGLCIGFFGPGKGSNHSDADHYDKMHLHDQLMAARDAANQIFGPGPWYCFSDGAYPISQVLQKGFVGRRTRDQNRFNGLCNRRGRVSVEWNFGNMCTKFPHIDTYRKMKIEQNPTAHWTHAAMLMHNWWVCCYGGLVQDFFDCEPPSLETYFDV